MSQRPYTPPYAPRPGDGRSIGGLSIGLLVGTGISAIIWGAAWNPTMGGPHSGTWLVVVPLAKILGACVLLMFERTRTAGVGVLISIALGVLIFFGSCFAHL